MKGFLILHDGTLFEGEWQGTSSAAVHVGEVVFNTSLSGYQEVLSDPSYYRQIVVMTAPEQGNYGVSDQERESSRIWASGFVCVQLNQSFRADRDGSLADELRSFQVPSLSGIDTRTLVLHLRSQGTPWGALVRADSKQEAKTLAEKALGELASLQNDDWVYRTSTPTKEEHSGLGSSGRIAVIDYGAKKNIIRCLQQRFEKVAVFNSRTGAEDILRWKPDGVMLTNGPGDPQTVKGAVEALRGLLGQLPIFGICMGHQILALALGAKTFKLKFGHRGGNHPVRDLRTGDVFMTSQNHGYAVDEKLPPGVDVTQLNLYDGTVEGIECRSRWAWSVQYHPEASPGPHDAQNFLFDSFAERLRTGDW